MRKEISAVALGVASCQVLAAEVPPGPAGPDGRPARGNFVSFYERAAARTAAGGPEGPDVARYRDLARYKIECSLQMPSGGYFTLARTDDRRAALFVWTDKGPVRALQKLVAVGTYSAMFDPPDRWGGSRDWGWIWDRNGDGRVDYFTFVDGAMPVMSEEIAHLVPKKPGAVFKIESKEELDLITKNMQLVFTHHADDNFDGCSDAVVAALHHPESPFWIYRYGVLRSRSLTQVIDENWSFVSHIAIKAGSVPTENGHFQVSFFSPGDQALKTSSKLLASINDGVRACRIPAGELPRE